jgi:2,4-dienoyl-CoA reductase [(3E)-enoyl-CoA-producing], peroxisomal
MSRLAPGDLKEKMERAIPIGRFGTIEEIADVSVFLCSDAARLVHGVTLVADGGAWFGMGRALFAG